MAALDPQITSVFIFQRTPNISGPTHRAVIAASVETIPKACSYHLISNLGARCNIHRYFAEYCILLFLFAPVYAVGG